METAITVNMLPDLFAIATLTTLAIYHLMIYWGRKKDAEEIYNFYFAAFIISATLFIIAPYLQPQYFLYAIKPSWLYVVNVEALMMVCLFFSGIKFLNMLLKVPQKIKRYFYFTYVTIPLNFLLTLTVNFISPEFYFTYILGIVLVISITNAVMAFTVYGIWMYRNNLYKENFYRILYVGFVSLNINILVYRTIELITIPNILVFNHYVSTTILFVFAYALSVKFNKEYTELKDLKVSLEEKVADRTAALEKSNRALERQNFEIESQKQEIVSINDELALRADELFELNQSRTRFFTGISHEFRTPLTLIIGPLEGLLLQVPDEKTKREYDLMLRQSKRLLSLINQLLELSKLQKGVQRLMVVHDNFNSFIQSILDTYSDLAKDLKIEIQMTSENTIQSWFDKDKVEKIVTNLLTNALKFTPEGGKIEITLRHSADKNFVVLSMRDTGIGIAPGELKNIFDPFFQVDSTAHHRIEGAGFGLSLVKEVVALHRGTIEVASEINKGTRFTVSIPANSAAYQPDEFIHEEAFESTTEEAIIDNGLRTRTERTVVLIVEDNTEMRSFIRSTLPSTYHVIEADNGEAGLELAFDWIPDIIVADVMMPVVTGLQMTINLKKDERTSHIPVILLTAKSSMESKIEGLSTQADDYVTKPFNAAELVLRIQNQLASRDRLREKFSKSITVNPSELVTTSVDEKFLQKALIIVEKNMGEAELNAEKFCDEIAMSRAQVHRKLKALTGQSVTHFIMSIKLKRAAQLLKQRAGSVSEIAYQTGFNNLSYFTRSFKEYHGALPSSYLVDSNEK